MMRAAVELISIGNELLLGETQDTNATWLSRELAAAGIAVARRATVGDDVAAIRDVLGDALRRTRFVVCTGGLGPTRDDLTRHAVAALYDRALVIDEGWVSVLRERYGRRGMDMPEINRIQGEHPAGATLLPNERGTAPGIVIDDDHIGTTILLPGVPSEMQWLMHAHVLPLLQRRFTSTSPIESRVLRTAGLTEAALAERISDIAGDAAPLSLAFLPQVAGVDLRLTAADATAARAFDRVISRLRERLGDHVYADTNEDLAAVVGRMLAERRMTIALAESCTGGLVGKRLTDPAGASAYMRGGMIAYANAAKQTLVGVSGQTLATHGAVSEQCARELADGARRRLDADVAISITGVAGPDGGSEAKPVGTVWIGVALRGRTEVKLFRLIGTREEIRERAAQASLDMLRRLLLAHAPRARA
jgi:nicotinamide-nucleotide amidase